MYRFTLIAVVVLVAFVLVGSGATAFNNPRNSEAFPHNLSDSMYQVDSKPSLSTTPEAVTTDTPGRSCTLINFEGLGNESPIPEFEGISSPGWLGLIDADDGGTGNFAYEPSPNTIAFWLGVDPYRDILFSEPVSEVSFYFASSVDVQLEAFDSDGNSVATATGLANYLLGPGGDPTGDYNQWDPIKVETNNNVITRVRVSGDVNQTGIDNLEVCSKIGIHSVEFTQAIQEWQTLDELLADLQGDGQPPVPIIAQKPLALRVYMEEVDTVTEVRVQLSGVATGVRNIQLQPNCTAEDSRKQVNGCQSIDFYFTPPAGQWTVTLKTFDHEGNEIESYDFDLTSVRTNPLVLRAVSVCDTQNPDDSWECADAKTLGSLTTFLSRTAPTHEIQVLYPGDVVRRDADDYTTDPRQWWMDIVQDIHNLGTIPYYYGMVRPAAPSTIGGIASAIPGHGAASRTSVIRLGVETNDQVVAHETGHMLGRRHTNTDDPSASGGTPPGCYNLASDSSTDWPYADNLIQSGTAENPELEVGFDVAARQAIDPQNHYEWMGYCYPRWISPHTYRNALTVLQTTTNVEDVSSEVVRGMYWRVSGMIEGSIATFEPLYEFETAEEINGTSGSHRIEIWDNTSTILYTSYFTPTIVHTESGDPADDIENNIFSELIPVQLNANRIVVLDSTDTEIGSIVLEGAAPAVSISSPAGGGILEGDQIVSWQITDSDSTDFVSWVQYSANGGNMWLTLSIHLGTSELRVNFDELPGSDGDALIRILVSDGVNTGTGTSAPFTVSKKLPTATIIFPEDGSVFRLGDIVWLQGQGFDLEDNPFGTVEMVWESSLDGMLGMGNQLPITTLSEGEHIITFTVEDCDGNITSEMITIFVDGTTPVLNLTVTPDGTPASCVSVSIDGFDPEVGSGLAVGQYSFDGGESWASIDLSVLPLTFTVPGEGYIHLVVRLLDHANNLAAADSKFFIQTPCSNLAPEAEAGTDYTGDEGQTITLDGSQSSDVDGTIILYEWDLDNDGEFDDAINSTPDVTFSDDGVYIVSLRVTDSSNATDVDTALVTIYNVPPDVEGGPGITVTLGDFINLENVTFTDPGTADSHTATVNWGDGTAAEVDISEGVLYAYHSYATIGDYIVEVCVIDDDGGFDCDTFTVTVSPPLYIVLLPIVNR
jgi:hypothetical protein